MKFFKTHEWDWMGWETDLWNGMSVFIIVHNSLVCSQNHSCITPIANKWIKVTPSGPVRLVRKHHFAAGGVLPCCRTLRAARSESSSSLYCSISAFFASTWHLHLCWESKGESSIFSHGEHFCSHAWHLCHKQHTNRLIHSNQPQFLWYWFLIQTASCCARAVDSWPQSPYSYNIIK